MYQVYVMNDYLKLLFWENKILFFILIRSKFQIVVLSHVIFEKFDKRVE